MLPEYKPPITEIVRYMSFSRFFDLIETESLFLPFATSFEDPLEGVKFYETNIQLNLKLSKTLYPEEFTEAKIKSARDLFAKGNTEALANKENIAISCWSDYNYESFHMWKSYANSKDAVAVVSTKESLEVSLNKNSPQPVRVDEVSYSHFSPSDLKSLTLTDLYFHKKSFFTAEKEVRAVMDASKAKIDKTTFETYLRENGVSIPIVINDVIKRIILAPDMPFRLEDLIRRKCQSKGLKANISRSSMEEKPTTA